MIAHHISAYTVTTTIAQIVTPIPGSDGIMIIQNQGDQDIYIGPSNVSSSNGVLIKSRSEEILSEIGPAYAIASTGSTLVVVDQIF